MSKLSLRAEKNHTVHIVATDRNGRHLETITLTKASVVETDRDRIRAYDILNAKYRDIYIFIERQSESSLPITPALAVAA